ncbi:GMC family oxidoreductase [Nocardiopsis sp. NRRL B-16309]|uniref:GMC family oxidoreductase n=1 Tax=Nocardiopsis sp. NRRL B-16309 TaxID=1519494 RepID=UPI0006ADCDAA|nr:GMC family oxidoreductase N-terminal domain-containing protein [Nocardiopsis sp. NRRL B-16309]KOX24115.1 choline dehydrogenase [Nocardiopsis sp. NRRL B-16309]
MYDFVIVGAGSAGCVLAARLSENPDARVCLVEAGPADDSEDIHVPAAAARLFRTEFDWDYDTHEEPHCGRRRIYLPRGRVLGGSSSINGMVYTRGSRADYDAWGQPGWSFAEMLPYFKRSEDNERGPCEHHGVGGPLSVADGRSRNPMSEAFVRAAQEAGFGPNPDFNGHSQEGFGHYQVTQRDGSRCSSAVAFLREAERRPNLTVVTEARVHRVVVEAGRAVGVLGRRLGEDFELRAEREVILSAGAYNSPQLLMLSGIGPAEQLDRLGVPVVVDQPLVGANLQDHPQTWLVFGHSRPVSLLTAGTEHNVRLFLRERTGVLTSNGPEAGGFVRTRAAFAEPDLQFSCLPVAFMEGGLSAPSGHGISFGSCVLAPRSRGEVTLASSDPTAKPRITHRYYEDDADLETAVEGVRTALEIARQPALAPYTETALAAPASTSDTDLRDYVRHHTQTLYHAAGTCAMGRVTDAELRVMGVEGLRVADASVMPRLVRGNTNAPTIAIAEKASDLILGVPPSPQETPGPARRAVSNP